MRALGQQLGMQDKEGVDRRVRAGVSRDRIKRRVGSRREVVAATVALNLSYVSHVERRNEYVPRSFGHRNVENLQAARQLACRGSIGRWFGTLHRHARTLPGSAS